MLYFSVFFFKLIYQFICLRSVFVSFSVVVIVGLVVSTNAIRLLQNDFYCNKNAAMMYCYSDACVAL